MDEKTLTGFIKEIGRGKNAAGDLSRDNAEALFSAMLAGDVADLKLGAILIALRVKGESLDELAGFAAACEASYPHLQPIAGGAIPVVIPSYNGARQLPNLVPLLAMLLAREGIPALVHGVTDDPGRVTTREVFAALGIAPAISASEARHQLATVGVSFLPINALAPEIAAMLAMRKELGVRNSAHTLVKMLQPFAGASVRIVSVTHPEYLVRMREYFTAHDTAALLLRGAEGEAVAHPRREPTIEWAFGGTVDVWKDEAAQPAALESLPRRDPKATAGWIESVLAGDAAVPAAIAHQLACCRRAVAALATPGVPS
ncbi:MAG TPA: DNA-binding protein YbiB [Burkholderiales bacterium]|nr:DNA-binding protein YbiB [Burkholderiales bacterium]